MPRAIPVAMRAELIEQHDAGAPAPMIAAPVGRNVRPVRAIWQRDQAPGDAGLAIGDGRGGRPGPRFPVDLVAVAIALKREHPTWGVGRGRVELAAAPPPGWRRGGGSRRMPCGRSMPRNRFAALMGASSVG